MFANQFHEYQSPRAGLWFNMYSAGDSAAFQMVRELAGSISCPLRYLSRCSLCMCRCGYCGIEFSLSGSEQWRRGPRKPKIETTCVLSEFIVLSVMRADSLQHETQKCPLTHNRFNFNIDGK